MDLIDKLQELAKRVETQSAHLETEEATKNALVLPFIQTLGYDVFNPEEVVPEFTADIGMKRGEKVDYAIRVDGQPTMLIECKKCGTDLSEVTAGQLQRYYHVTDAKIGVITDGIRYHFYTDLDKPNKMDSRPYMELDVRDVPESLIPELKKLTKSSFDIEQAIAAATDLKYTKEIRRKLSEMLNDPDREFVKYFTQLVYSGRFTQNVQEQFTPIVKKAFQQFIREQINERLESAIAVESEPEEDVSDDDEIIEEEGDDRESRIDTTEAELDGYHIVRAILSQVVDPDRVVHRDTISYMGILLDDNNRKPICRLHFNTSQKYLGLIDENKNEEKIPIESIKEIYQYADRLRKTSQYYE